jgi:hypothetical protein
MPGPGTCVICNHDRKVELELGLVAKVPLATLASRYEVSIDSLKRHSRNHLSASAAAALALNLAPTAVDLERLSKSESESLLGNLVTQRARLAGIAEKALADGELGDAIRAERATTDVLALTSKLLGMIVARSASTVTHVTLDPRYLRMRQALVEVLRPHPEIAAKVAAALREIEASDAADIMARATPATPPGPALIEHAPSEVSDVG